MMRREMGSAWLVGGVVGAVAGVVGAVLAAALQLAARRARNRALVAKGVPAIKDEVFLPMWKLLGAVGLGVGAVCGAVDAGSLAALAAGLVLPTVVALTAVISWRQGR